MTLRLHDSKTKTTSEFTPLHEGRVTLYVCGPTVQDGPHVGHVRTFLAFDVLVRWLRRSGYEVTFVRNVTDIDDKILTRAREQDRPWWAVSLANERIFHRTLERLGALAPDYEPRASGHVPEMIDFMQRLIERGHAYPDGDTSVYFDVGSLESYGSLTRQNPAHLVDDAESSAEGKRSVRDFALWKKAKDDEPLSASWNTPFGRGRPGWHLECSAMAHKYLGEQFDIHGGGLDLRFPHHENEQAQSYAAGYGFAQRWMHAGMLTVDGMKMGKSLGNFITAEQILERFSAAAVRLAIVGSHYRATVEFNDTTLREAETVIERLSSALSRAYELTGDAPGALSEHGANDDLQSVALPETFVAAMNDDLAVAEALAVVHAHLAQLNSAIAAKKPEREAIRTLALELRAMLDVFGLDLMSGTWRKQDSHGGEHAALDALIRAHVQEREAARERKDWASADAIRDRLSEAGIVIEDSPAGARWSIRD